MLREALQISKDKCLTKCITDSTSAAAIDQCEEMTHGVRVQKQQNQENGRILLKDAFRVTHGQ